MGCVFPQENQQREAAERRRRCADSVRVASKRHSIASYLGSQPQLEASSLESTLHSFLSTVPRGARRSRLAPVHGSPSECKTKPAGRTQPVAGSEGRAEKKRTKPPEDERKAERSTKDDPEDSAQRSGGAKTSPAAPRTPRPTTRDYYFGHGGEPGSPWTVLSPVTSVHGEARNGSQSRLSPASRGDHLEDGVWDPPASCSRGAWSSPCQDPPPDGPGPRRKPAVRSASVDESSQVLTSRFSLGELFQRSVGQRSYSHGSRTEPPRAKGARPPGGCKWELEAGKAGSSGLISFFRRIGGKSKAVGAEEPVPTPRGTL